MTCPYCNREINALTGFMEAEKFEKHLHKCQKNPNNIRVTDVQTGKTHTTPRKRQDLLDALEIRAKSGQ